MNQAGAPMAALKSALKSVVSRMASYKNVGLIAQKALISHEGRLLQLKRLGFEPKTVFDIGAYRGEWSRCAGRVFSAATIHMFEANEENEAFLAKTGNPYVIAALSDKSGKKVFHMPKAGLATGASFYRENTAFYDDCRMVEKHAFTLDEVVKSRRIERPDFIKLDVQGSEIDVLRGASECLKSCAYLLVEASITNYNEGAPLIFDIMGEMNRLGFTVVDLFECHYDKDGWLLQIDLLFARSNLSQTATNGGSALAVA
jgi:FkbM family methyltransferase